MDEAAMRHGLVGSPRLWEMKRRFQFDFLVSRGLAPDDHLLDLGCGTLRGGIPLIAYLDPGHYTGIDVRSEAIDEGRLELARHRLGHKAPELLAITDLDGCNIGGTFSQAWAFSVLIHMHDDALAAALGFVCRHLDAGVFHANVNIGRREPAGWREFPLVWRSMAMYRDIAADAGMTVEDIGSLGELGHVSGVAEQDAQRMLRFTRT